MSALFSVQAILPILAAVIPGSGVKLGQTIVEQYHGLLATKYVGLKTEILHDIVSHGGAAQLTLMPMGTCPNGQQFQQNGVIKTINNINGFIFALGWALVPSGFILGLILYIYGWNENVKGWGRRLMVGSVVILGGILLWGAIVDLIKLIAHGSCTPT